MEIWIPGSCPFLLTQVSNYSKRIPDQANCIWMRIRGDIAGSLFRSCFGYYRADGGLNGLAAKQKPSETRTKGFFNVGFYS